MRALEVRKLSSLANIFENKIYGKALDKADTLKGQEFCFQIAFRGEKKEYTFEIESAFGEHLNVGIIGYVPSEMPSYGGCGDNYLRQKAGMFGDPIFPLEEKKITADKKWQTLFVSIDIPNDFEAGEYPISVLIYDNGKKIRELKFDLTVHSYVLPKQELILTEWFYCDCIADFHKVDAFSKEHWELIEKYIKTATSHGVNMILTPILTPPLDTVVGGERTTTQLVDITYENEKYTFEFSKLNKFIEICKRCGVEYYEINHMFTQWGAKFAPKVMAASDGKYKKIFGWETDATSSEYVLFLQALIPEIIKAFEQNEIKKERLFFHVSDEPSQEHLESYKKASAILKPLIEGCKQIDALSNYEFYEQKMVKTPVVATDHIEPFLKNKVSDLWCYYCCAETVDVANRFFSMPSHRNRIIGVQMYKHDIVGFLHWGYNFYNTQFSKAKINPYEVTDAGKAFPSGDAFCVYPYKNGVIPSFRLKVFKNAIEDIRLLKLVESKIGKKEALALIERVAKMDITFRSYPKTNEFFDQLYKEIFKVLD